MLMVLLWSFAYILVGYSWLVISTGAFGYTYTQ